jgi:hypothetical protein
MVSRAIRCPATSQVDSVNRIATHGAQIPANVRPADLSVVKSPNALSITEVTILCCSCLLSEVPSHFLHCRTGISYGHYVGPRRSSYSTDALTRTADFLSNQMTRRITGAKEDRTGSCFLSFPDLDLRIPLQLIKDNRMISMPSEKHVGHANKSLFRRRCRNRLCLDGEENFTRGHEHHVGHGSSTQRTKKTD